MLEATLITGLACEGGASFELVLRQWQPQILRAAYRILGNWADAEDVAQEAFFKLHRHGLGFANDTALGAWLYRVTVNLCFGPGALTPLERAHRGGTSGEFGRGRGGGIGHDSRAGKAAPDGGAGPVADEGARGGGVLREIEGLTTAETAAALGSTEGTVRSQIFRAMAKLREMLAEERG